MKPGTKVTIFRRRGVILNKADGYLAPRGYVYVDWEDGSPSWVPIHHLKILQSRREKSPEKNQ